MFLSLLLDAGTFVWSLLQDVGLVVWLSQPLIYANMLPVVLGGGRPMDFGAYGADGRRLLGDGKTWQGFWGGIAGAVIATFSLTILVNNLAPNSQLYDVWEMDTFGFIPHMTWLALGALMGDAIKSYFKRRIGFDRGQAWAFYDQFDAVLGGFTLSLLFDHRWFMANFLPGRWLAVVILLGVYHLTHRALSRWAHRRGWKSSPF